ncbi:hypothetical protein AB1Y20_005118 [Prymnesium parvum]|uniref:Uncharacterized protein n=1 Tax=Prymnesium parvum TaxID=97485 RepID=A0AB34J2V7_PRYPA
MHWRQGSLVLRVQGSSSLAQERKCVLLSEFVLSTLFKELAQPNTTGNSQVTFFHRLLQLVSNAVASFGWTLSALKEEKMGGEFKH